MEAQNEKMVNNGDVVICTEHFGSSDNPVILLIAGATVSMLYWDADFCSQLAGKGYFVIRYDNRDVGKSTTYDVGTTPYDIVDLVNDAVCVLDGYGVAKANIMGISLGGLIAQLIALQYPNRVQSLILMSTGVWGMPDPDIPEMEGDIVDFQAKAGDVDWDNEEEVVGYLLESSRLMAGSKPVDYQREERRIRGGFRRTVSYRSMFNHAGIQGGEAYYNRTSEIHAPTLIIHGTADKIWHFDHTKKLLAEINDSRLLTLDGAGHELNVNDWASIANAVDDFTS